MLPDYFFQYALETFCEKRTTCRVEVPHYPNQPVDGPFNGAPPLPWDIPVSPEREFADLEYKLPVPHTAEVRVRSFFQLVTSDAYHRAKATRGLIM